MVVAITLHLLAAVVWVGGMLAMLLVVRPTAVALLEPPLRLRFMATALGRFFPWVWGAVVLLPASGYWLLYGVFASPIAVPAYLLWMQGIGWLMITLFVYISLGLYPRLNRALSDGEMPLAAAVLERVRRLVTVNAILGIAVVTIAVAGRYGV